MPVPVVPDQPVQWSVRHALALLVGAQVLQVLWYGVVAGLAGIEAGDTISMPLLVVLQVALILAYLVGPLSISDRLGNGWRRDLTAADQPVLTVGDVGGGLALGVVAQVVLINGLYEVIGRFVEVDAGEAARDLADRASDPVGVVALVWMTVVVAPLIEEVFFRGLLLRSLASAVPVGAAVALAAVLFALVHFQPVQAPGLFVIGAVAGAATVRTGRLATAWLVHVGFNLTAVVQLLVAG